jgi:hypothetical protein
MTSHLATRISAFGLATFVTLAMLGSVHHLATLEPAAHATSALAAASRPAA